ncbi:hypothetical protein D9758_008405 [Tetrapyrgos nigripes]|uniref:DUF453-domain-containing protein n=1 Tax=Tetrapyrgos nigripes TaxID=182062 RepID=A0A8H5GEB9_9AGAR|nr:hypothetical protein D9758_008405 [Tetrapyrgos nigripes]
MLLARRSGSRIGQSHRAVSAARVPSHCAHHSTYTEAQNRAMPTSSPTPTASTSSPAYAGVTKAAWNPPNPLPANFIRGGTSKGIFINQTDLPSLIPPSTSSSPSSTLKAKDEEHYETWKRVLLGIMGSPDPEHGRQLNGMGGGISSLSKVVLVRPINDSTAETKKLKEEGVHVEYTFVQVGIRDDAIDIEGNCGNLSSVVGVFALGEGMVPIQAVEENKKGREAVWKDKESGRWYATIKAYNTNTKKVVQTTFPVQVEASSSSSSSSSSLSNNNAANVDAEAGVTPFTTTSPHMSVHTPTSASTSPTQSTGPTTASSPSSSPAPTPSLATSTGTSTTPHNDSPTVSPTVSPTTTKHTSVNFGKSSSEGQTSGLRVTPLLSLPEAGIAGVPGKASRIDLEFLNPAGARTGKLLPSHGGAVTHLENGLPDLTTSLIGKTIIPTSLVDASNPTVFVDSSHMEPYFADYLKDPEGESQTSGFIRDLLEALRLEGAVKMGLWTRSSSSKSSPPQAQPKICVITAPIMNDVHENNVDIVVHALSMGTLHKAIPMTVGLALGVAAGIKGTVVWDVVRKSRTARAGISDAAAIGDKLVRIRHPSGIVDVGADIEYVDEVDGNGEKTRTTVVKSAKVVRTGRRLMRGEVWW